MILGCLGVVMRTTASTQTRVVPPGYEFRPGNYDFILAGSDRTIRHQIGYGATLFDRPAVAVKEMAFRGESQVSQPPLKVHVRLYLSSTTRPTSHFVLWPDDVWRNAGSNQTLVFDGIVDLPQDYPRTYAKPFLARLPLQQSFVFLPGRDKTLVADLTTRVTQGNGWWHIDAVTGIGDWDPGKFSQYACPFKDGNRLVNWVQAHQTLVIGGQWGPIYRYHVPVGIPGLHILGFTDIGHLWNGIRLGIAIPNAPRGCVIAVGPELIRPFLTGPVTQVPRLPIVYESRLVGATFYDQPIFFEKGANAAGVVAGPSSRWKIGWAPEGIWQTEHRRSQSTGRGGSVGIVPVTEFR